MAGAFYPTAWTHQLGLLLLVVVLFFDLVTLVFKSTSSLSLLPWPMWHVPFVLEFSQSFQSYMQSHFMFLAP